MLILVNSAQRKAKFFASFKSEMFFLPDPCVTKSPCGECAQCETQNHEVLCSCQAGSAGANVINLLIFTTGAPGKNTTAFALDKTFQPNLIFARKA